MESGINKEIIAKCFKEILERGLNLDLEDPNFKDTPERVARSYSEIFSGISHCEEDIKNLFKKCFPTNYSGIIAEKNIIVFSMCPHHFLPIRYNVSLGYIPSRCGLGLSKLTRLVELIAKKPVLQEAYTQEVVDLIELHMEPLGAICIVEGEHNCMRMRGAKQKNVITITSAARGIFLTKPEMELKFYEIIKKR